jgi:hypothetical protein
LTRIPFTRSSSTHREPNRSAVHPEAPLRVAGVADAPAAGVEGVEQDRFTQVLQSRRQRTVRMDFRVLASEPPGSGGEPSGHRTWGQEIQGTPFERVLEEAITEVLIQPGQGGTSEVTIAQLQRLRGYSRTGALMLRRTTNQRLDEALDGLARLCG